MRGKFLKTDSLSVLLVDDEYLIRELLKNCIQWERMDCKIVGEASCAVEVFDFLKETPVDLIITDINMPKTDGLQMSEKILSDYPKIKIIVVSGYDKFEYAKNGFKIGIEDYILKPIRESEVERAVLNVKEKLEKERENEYENALIREQLEHNIPYLREKFFIELFKNKLSLTEMKEKIRFLKLEFRDNFFQVALTEIFFNEKEKYSEEKRLTALLEAVHILEVYFKDRSFIYILLDTKENISVFCNNSNVDLIEECKCLLEIIKAGNPEWDITIGIGSIKKQIENTNDCYSEAVTSLQFKAILGANRIINYNDLDVIINKINQVPIAQENAIDQLQFLIKAGLNEQSLDYIDSLYENIGRYRSIEEHNFIMHVRIQTTRILVLLFDMIASMDIRMDSIAQYQEDCFKEIASITTIPYAKQLTISLVEKLIKHINTTQTHLVNDYMEDILDYIQKNMSDYGLTLNKIAAKFYMNPSYLSRIFKQRKGITFKDYLNRIRMEQALEYVRNTDLKAYAIGEKVGIPDANYFSTSFKKYIGMSMTDYKKIIVNEE